jgi:hypothetical protein
VTLHARADLHVHSRFSNRPTEWFLERVGAPESYTDPLVVYRRCREREMTLVTLTDHDTIDGALEIAHLPGTFLSCEVTVRFPEDGCPFHCLVFGIDERQHRDIQGLRDDVYALRDYLYDHRIAHSVAHPLFGVDRRLRLEHVEKLLVLFKCFEGLNGAHDARQSMVTRAVLNNLTARQLDELANRHDLDPRDDEPWRKHLTAGSDDHCGLYVASAWSSVQAEGPMSAGRFLEQLRSGELSIEGAAGSSLKLGRGLHRIAARYARTRCSGDDGAMQLLAWMSDSIARAGVTNGEDFDPAHAWPIPGGVGGGCAATGGRTGLPAFVGTAVRSEILAGGGDRAGAETASYRMAARIGQRLLVEGLWRGIAALRDGELAGALDAWPALLPASLAVAPYLVAWRSHHKDEPLVRAVADRFPAARLLRERSGRTAWFRDSSTAGIGDEDISVEQALEIAGGAECLAILHLPGAAIDRAPVACRMFQPVGDLRRLGAGPQSLAIPPVLDLIDHCERERFDRVLVSGLGPMAAAARCVASCLELDLVPVVTVAAYEHLATAVRELVPESALASYLRWLLAPATEILVGGEDDRALLERIGIPAQRTRLMELVTLQPLAATTAV